MEKYRYIKKIGEGGFGCIWQIQDDKGEFCCDKTVRAYNVRLKELVLQEIDILKHLDHPNIVRLLHYFTLNDGCEYHLIMELVDGMTLRELITEQREHRKFFNGRFFPEDFILKILNQILHILAYCFEQKTLHRDKPENIMITRDLLSIKLIDFGVSRKVSTTNGSASTYTGTNDYMSPEIIDKVHYTHLTDVWSLGIILYELVCMHYPFSSTKGMRNVLKRIKRGKFHEVNKFRPDVSTKLTKVIKGMLNSNQKERFNLLQIGETLQFEETFPLFEKTEYCSDDSLIDNLTLVGSDSSNHSASGNSRSPVRSNFPPTAVNSSILALPPQSAHSMDSPKLSTLSSSIISRSRVCQTQPAFSLSKFSELSSRDSEKISFLSLESSQILVSSIPLLQDPAHTLSSYLSLASSIYS